MEILYKDFCKNVIFKETHLCFPTNYSADFIKIYIAFKIEKIVNHEHFVIFNFFQLRYIKGTNSEYFHNSISEANISSVT